MSVEILPNAVIEECKLKQAVSQAFGAIAPYYDLWYTTPLGRYVWSVESKAMKAMLPYIIHSVILEIGVGTGMALSLLQTNSAQIIGGDIAWEMVNIAYHKSKVYQYIHLLVADGEYLPFRQNCVDLVLGMTVLEFVPQPNLLLQEIHRCLQSKGQLLLGVLTSINLWALERRIRSYLSPDVFKYAKFLSPWQIFRMLYRNGFSKAQYRGAVYAPSFVSKQCLRSFQQIDESLGTRWLSRALGAFCVIYTRCDSSH